MKDILQKNEEIKESIASSEKGQDETKKVESTHNPILHVSKTREKKSAFLRDDSDADKELQFKTSDEKWKGFGKKKVKTFFN